jgi:hypothetical protein
LVVKNHFLLRISLSSKAVFLTRYVMASFLVVGGAGSIGQSVVKELFKRDPWRLYVVDIVERFYSDARPEVVIHLVAEVGGIGANRANPGRFAYANLSVKMIYGTDTPTNAPYEELCWHRNVMMDPIR